MNRRALLIALVAVAAPVASRKASAQSRPPFRIGLLPSLGELRRGQFVDAMREEGWTEGEEFVVVDSGFKFGPEIEKAANRMVDLAPDLILVATEAYAAAAQRLTERIPIVMWVSGYPVEGGVAHSLARPGKNVTGSANYAGTGVWGKLLELLRDTKPGIERVGILWDFLPPAFQAKLVTSVQTELRRDFAKALGLTVHVVDVVATERAGVAMEQI
ncbi:MAG TPA: ABC transporter substrate binding protein, partial [Burkholderiales bacterium]|nr:ABC transporter substrate binding protein [Burkholderiales bacterium]